MNAKEKAKQLVDKFYRNPYPKQDAKDCVDEIINAIEDISVTESMHTDAPDKLTYWSDVRSAFEKL